jgi:hypothetical protein
MVVVCEGTTTTTRIMGTTLIVILGQPNDPMEMIDIITKDLRATKISSHISQNWRMIIGIKIFINTKETEAVMC